MPISSLSAAKKLCELSGWKLSNLALQKILYIAQMVYMGRNNGAPLIDDMFEAWDYGPVLPAVYHKAKIFGAGSVLNVFHSVQDLPEGPENEILRESVEKLGNVSPGTLVSMTHRDGGAWAKHYSPGLNSRIPNSDILAEYKARVE